MAYDLLNQDIASNTSTVRLYNMMRSFDGYTGSGSTCNGYINEEFVGSFDSISANEYKQIGYKDIVVQHDDAGNGTFSASASIVTPWTLGNSSCSGNATLPKISRQANLTTSADILVNGLNTVHNLSFDNPANVFLGLQYIINGEVKIYKALGQITNASITFSQTEIEELLKVTSYTLRVHTADIGYKDIDGIVNRQGILRTPSNILIPYYNDGSGAKLCTAFVGTTKGV